jgi:hypothetical protein
VYSVFFIDWQPEIEVPPPPVRPLKTMVITSLFAAEGIFKRNVQPEMRKLESACA